MRRRLSFIAMAAAVWLAAGVAASAEPIKRLASLETPIFTCELPYGWSATWYDSLNSVIVTPANDDPKAPSLLVGLGDGSLSLDAEMMASRLSELVTNGGAFSTIVDRWNTDGHLLVFENERRDLRAAIWLALFGGERRPAVALLVAPRDRFQAIDGVTLVERVASTVRQVNRPSNPVRGPRAAALVPRAGAAPSTGASTRARPALASTGVGPAGSPPPQAEATPAPTRAAGGLSQYLDRPLAAADVSSQTAASGAVASPMHDLILVLRREGVVERRKRDGSDEKRGVWLLDNGAIRIDWAPALDGPQKPPNWKLRLTPDGLRTHSVVFQQLVELDPQILRGRFALVSGDRPFNVRPVIGGAPISATRITFGDLGRFSIADDGDRSAGGRYAVSDGGIVLEFWGGANSRHVVRPMGLGSAGGPIVKIDGRRFEWVSED